MDYARSPDMDGIPYLLRRLITNAMLLESDKAFDTEYQTIDQFIRDYGLATGISIIAAAPFFSRGKNSCRPAHKAASR